MSANIPFYRGQNAVFKFYQNNKPVYIPTKVWNIDENATEVADGVSGEKRDRLDKVTNFYSATLEIFQTDQTVMQAYMAAQDADDNVQLPLKQTGALQIEHRDGTRAAYLLTEMKVGPMKTSNGSRSDAVMLTLNVRFRFFKAVPSI